MRVSMILNTHNEGPDVARTIRSFADHAGGADLEFVVVADGTTDGSCDDLDAVHPRVLVLKAAERLGCGKAKDVACRHATGDVIWHNDAHNRLVRGTVADLAALCVERGPCVVTPAVGPLVCARQGACARHASAECAQTCPEITDNDNVPANCYQGGVLAFGRAWGHSAGLHVHNTITRPTEAVLQTQTVNPSCFAYTRATLERLGGWNRYPGLWGSQELGISLRAWFTATPIYNARDVVCLHRYRSWNHPQGKAVAPYSVPSGHRGANARYATRVVFDEATWDAVWRPWFDRGGRDAAADALVEASEIGAQHAAFLLVKSRTDDEFFERICGHAHPARWRRSATSAGQAVMAVGAGIGNALMTIPAQRALAAHVGKPIDLLVLDEARPGREAVELLGMQPWIRRVVGVGVDYGQYEHVVSTWGSVEIDGLMPTGTAVWTAELKWRTRHEVEGNLDTVRRMGWSGVAPAAELATWRQPAMSLPDGYVAVGVGTNGMRYKRWPHLEACCRDLAAAGVPLVFVGRGDEREPWMTAVGTDCMGQTTLAEAAGLLWSARLYLGVDNGLSHLAAAVRCPSVLVYGPTRERKNAPWSTACEIIRADTLTCAPCWEHPRSVKCAADEAACMAAVKPEWVAARVLAALERPAWQAGRSDDLHMSRRQELLNLNGADALQTRWEFNALLDVLRARPVRAVMEIGAADGGTLWAWCEMLEGFKDVLVIDPNPTAWNVPKRGPAPPENCTRFPEVVAELRGRGHAIEHLRRPSDEALVDAADWFAVHGPVDLLHIDGDHDYPQARRDWDQYRGFVRPGGLVVLHDVANHPGPRRLLAEIEREYAVRRFTTPAKGFRQGLGIAVVEMPPTTR